ncbi:hypothetical protein [Streptomyces microflavus]|uniref:hypothetical protein n=1 Tax=Streptomyces microflavus TaxID=1919 RepID=UPI0036C4DC3B
MPVALRVVLVLTTVVRPRAIKKAGAEVGVLAWSPTTSPARLDGRVLGDRGVQEVLPGQGTVSEG